VITTEAALRRYQEYAWAALSKPQRINIRLSGRRLRSSHRAQWRMILILSFGPTAGPPSSKPPWAVRRTEATVEWSTKVDLFERLRREYEFGFGTIRGVARKFGVQRRLVREAARQALPPPRKRAQPNRVLSRIVRNRGTETRSSYTCCRHALPS
jgi:ribosomal protein S14